MLSLIGITPNFHQTDPSCLKGRFYKAKKYDGLRRRISVCVLFKFESTCIKLIINAFLRDKLVV